jgi:HSP20 family protein
MAEAHIGESHDKTTQTSDRAVGGTRAGGVEGERRSFQGNGETAHASAAGPAVAHNVTQAGARMAAMSAQAPFVGARLLSRSVEPFYAMQVEMMRWMDDLWREAMAGLRPAQPSRAMSFAPLVGLPPTDVTETEQSYKLCVELPGLAREDIELSVQGDALILTGHKAEDREETARSYRLSERRFGRFERTFPLPPEVARDKLEAAFKDGLLKVTLPKAPQATTERRSQVHIKA